MKRKKRIENILLNSFSFLAFKVEDISILHLGNIQSSLKPSQIEELSPVDVILLPYKNTLMELELAQFIQKIEAKLIIPIDTPEESNKTTNLLKELGAIVIEPRNKLNLKKNLLKEMLVHSFGLQLL